MTQDAIKHMRRSLDGLSIGDALGKQWFSTRHDARSTMLEALPAGPWPWTDDTAMALAIGSALAERGEVDVDDLAARFANHFAASPERGYGALAYHLLFRMSMGEDWRTIAGAFYKGQGSKGNGAAMRVAPLGAYFANDLIRVADEARKSASITHTHPDGQAGAIAVALAAALNRCGHVDWLETVASKLPMSETRSNIMAAVGMRGASVVEAARMLGVGQDILSADTLPFALWVAARHPRDYQQAIAAALTGCGVDNDADADTLLAIVGGVVAASPDACIPQSWLSQREVLPPDWRMVNRGHKSQ